MNNTNAEEKKQEITEINNNKETEGKKPSDEKSSIPPKAINRDYTYIW